MPFSPWLATNLIWVKSCSASDTLNLDIWCHSILGGACKPHLMTRSGNRAAGPEKILLFHLILRRGRRKVLARLARRAAAVFLLLIVWIFSQLAGIHEVSPEKRRKALLTFCACNRSENGSLFGERAPALRMRFLRDPT
ncbi:hypothetical protein EVAR_69184_1 [Eumeta japonica]|uniref:Uncharacterized protein n=1 Tax=Eumeta variegata TaxID=151549 RepID=A0A4C2A8W4_EUMVA|nr:hypothetical protein EVAR_69184_1 [Eumeta japonica]